MAFILLIISIIGLVIILPVLSRMAKTNDDKTQLEAILKTAPGRSDSPFDGFQDLIAKAAVDVLWKSEQQIKDLLNERIAKGDIELAMSVNTETPIQLRTIFSRANATENEWGYVALAGLYSIAEFGGVLYDDKHPDRLQHAIETANLIRGGNPDPLFLKAMGTVNAMAYSVGVSSV